MHPCHPLYTHPGHYQPGSNYMHTGTRPYGCYGQCRTDVMDNANDVANNDSDDDREFTDDKDGFVIMTRP
jgi:hypothetical protein